MVFNFLETRWYLCWS